MAAVYVSTRGGVPPTSFEEALLAGYCVDGGLFVPERMPTISTEWLDALGEGADFVAVADATLRLFIAEDEVPTADLRRIVRAAFGTFHHAEVAPVVALKDGMLIAELFHGQTLAFKDFGQSLVCALLEFFAARRSLRVHVLVSTTGDTGPAAIEAVRAHCHRVRVTAMYPLDRISELQRRQMTTVRAPNVRVLPFEGEGDDLDGPIKALSLDAPFRDAHGLCAINSINLGRVVSQTVHHVWAYLKARDAARREGADASARPPRVVVIVPTGAMGNCAAGLWCIAAGLPVHRLVLATNDNDVVARAVTDALLERRPMAETVSEAMNTQLPYNFERALFLAAGSDGARVARWMAVVDAGHPLELEPDALAWLRARVIVGSASNTATLERIASTWRDDGYAVDPHTAVGLEVAAAARANCSALATADGDGALVQICLATAHPCKFEHSVSAALGGAWWAAEMMGGGDEVGECPEASRMPARARLLASLPEETCAPLRVGEDWTARLRAVIESASDSTHTQCES
jgi:threonine synthase